MLVKDLVEVRETEKESISDSILECRGDQEPGYHFGRSLRVDYGQE